jgi:hypothetical protein
MCSIARNIRATLINEMDGTFNKLGANIKSILSSV